MNSTITIDASRVPQDPGARRAASPSLSRSEGESPRLTFGGVLRSERIKLSSLLSIRLTIIITVVLGLLLNLLIAVIWGGELGEQAGGDLFGTGDAAIRGYLLLVATSGASFLALVFGVLGVFALASEYSSGMILSTLTAVPKRTPVFVAKALVLSVLSALAALVIVGGGLGIAVAFKPEAAAQLGSLEVLSGAAGAVAYLVLITLFAYGVAGLLRSTAGGIGTIAGMMFVLPIAFQLLGATGWEWVTTANQYLPTSLGGTLSLGAVDSPVGPSFVAAFGALLLWVAVVVIPAGLAFKRRDAK